MFYKKIVCISLSVLMPLNSIGNTLVTNPVKKPAQTKFRYLAQNIQNYEHLLMVLNLVGQKKLASEALSILREHKINLKNEVGLKVVQGNISFEGNSVSLVNDSDVYLDGQKINRWSPNIPLKDYIKELQQQRQAQHVDSLSKRSVASETVKQVQEKASQLKEAGESNYNTGAKVAKTAAVTGVIGFLGLALILALGIGALPMMAIVNSVLLGAFFLGGVTNIGAMGWMLKGGGLEAESRKLSLAIRRLEDIECDDNSLSLTSENNEEKIIYRGLKNFFNNEITKSDGNGRNLWPRRSRRSRRQDMKRNKARKAGEESIELNQKRKLMRPTKDEKDTIRAIHKICQNKTDWNLRSLVKNLKSAVLNAFDENVPLLENDSVQ